MLQTIVIGGSGGRGSLFLRELARRDDTVIKAVVYNRTRPEKVAPEHLFTSLREALEYQQFDLAVISLPHGLHEETTRQLIQAGVPRIIKEKPLASSNEELEFYARAVEAGRVKIFTTTQRTILPSFIEGHRKLDSGLLGEIQGFEYVYTFSLPEATSGWRTDPALAKGGVLLDMGYHAIKEIIGAFGEPMSVSSRSSYIHFLKYKLEDRIEVKFEYPKFAGTLILDRHADKKDEFFRVQGSLGELVITPESPLLKDKAEQVTALFERALNPAFEKQRIVEYANDLITSRLIQNIYQLAL